MDELLLSQDFLATLLCLLSYLIGGIPTGKILVWRLKKINIQDFGSKNIGATNVYRVLGLGWALLVFGLDFLKGFLLPIVAWVVTKDTKVILLVTLIAVLGNIFPPYLRFRGGKGVASTTGACFFLFHILTLIAFIFALVIMKLTKKMSLATFSGLGMCLGLVLFLRQPEEQIFMVLVTLLLLFTHRSNIKRLLRGEELSLDSSKI